MRAHRPILLALPLLLLASGCGQRQIVRGAPVKIERRLLAPASFGYRLARRGPGRAVLRRTALCPYQERRVYRKVELRRESPAIVGARGVGCALRIVGEAFENLAGQRTGDITNCKGESRTDRRERAGRIIGAWKTLREQPCGEMTPLAGGGALRVRFLQTGTAKEYALGPNGVLEFPPKDLAELRLYLTILKDLRLHLRFRDKTWRQRIDLE